MQYNFRVITEKNINKLEGLMNQGWEVYHTVASNIHTVFLLKKKR